MKNIKLKFITVLGIFIISLLGLVALKEQVLSAVPGVNGWFGVYNTTSTSYLRDGQSANASLDQTGKVLVSPSSSLTVSSIGTAANPVTNGYISNLYTSTTSISVIASSTLVRVGDGTAAIPSISFSADTDTGLYRIGSNSIGVALAGVLRSSYDSSGNFILTGGTASGQSNIQFQSAASNAYDTNLFHISSTTMTMGMIAGSTPTYAAANGPFIGLRGNTYSAVLTQRGNLFFGAGNPSTPATGEGEIRFTTGADVLRLVVDKAGVIYMPTPTTNRFVAGGTAALGGSTATIIGNTTGVGVLAIQNTTAANAGYAQIDLYNSSGTNVAGFGYGNSATIAATQDRTYFYTVAKDFHVSTDSNVTRNFVVAATSGAVSITSKVTSGGVAGFTYTPGAHTAVTANVTDFKVAAHTMTITGGYSSQIFSHFAAPTVTAASGLTLTYGSNVTIEMASVAGSALITNNTGLFLGSPSTAVTVNNAAGTHLSLLETGNQSFTLTTTTQITNAIGVAGATFGTMTVNQSGGAVTVDNSATVYIAGPLTAGSSVTLTKNYSLFVDSGDSRFDGDVYVSTSTKGIILTSPDGTCARGTIDNADTLTFSSVTCP